MEPYLCFLLAGRLLKRRFANEASGVGKQAVHLSPQAVIHGQPQELSPKMLQELCELMEESPAIYIEEVTVEWYVLIMTCLSQSQSTPHLNV